MLANNFKSPAELNITEAHRDGLVQVLGMLERQEIPEHLFDMNTVGKPGCGTAGCILGWVRSVAVAHLGPENDGLVRLYYPQDDDCFEGYGATRDQAASAVRNYLTTGTPQWADVMGL